MINIPEIRQRLSNNTAIDAKEIQALCDEVESNQWVSVDDRLPEQGNYVWIYSPDEGFETKKQRSIRYDCNDYLWEEKIITHWKPLPKPPVNTELNGD